MSMTEMEGVTFQGWGAAKCIAAALVDRSVLFTVIPLPDDEWDIQYKPENHEFMLDFVLYKNSWRAGAFTFRRWSVEQSMTPPVRLEHVHSTKKGGT